MKKNHTIAKFQKNVSGGEQIISVAAGSYLLFKALQKKSSIRSIIGGFLLARGVTGFCPAYKMASIDTTTPAENILVKTFLTVNKPRQEVYAFWRKLENLPSFMKHLKSVEVSDDRLSNWEANIPGGLGTVKWQSEIIADVENTSIAWRSLTGSQIENAGAVSFNDAGKFGTEIQVNISYKAPARNIGAGISKLFTSAFEGMIKEDIKNFRRIIETGEIPTIEGQASGKNK